MATYRNTECWVSPKPINFVWENERHFGKQRTFFPSLTPNNHPTASMLFRKIVKKFRTEEEDIAYAEEALWKFCAFASICIIMTAAAHMSKTTPGVVDQAL